MISSADIQRLDAILAQTAAKAVEYRARCAAGNELRCDGGFELVGRMDFRLGKPTGLIESLRLGDTGIVRDLDVVRGTLRRAGLGLHARCGDGNRIEGIRFEENQAVLTCSRDFERLASAIEALAGSAGLAAPVFRPALIVRELHAALGQPPPAIAPTPTRSPALEFGGRSSRQ